MKFVRIEVRLSGLLNEAIELDSRSYRGNIKHRLLEFVTFLSSGSERGGCAVVHRQNALCGLSQNGVFN